MYFINDTEPLMSVPAVQRSVINRTANSSAVISGPTRHSTPLLTIAPREPFKRRQEVIDRGEVTPTPRRLVLERRQKRAPGGVVE
jgi:hypothetical protein